MRLAPHAPCLELLPRAFALRSTARRHGLSRSRIYCGAIVRLRVPVGLELPRSALRPIALSQLIVSVCVWVCLVGLELRRKSSVRRPPTTTDLMDGVDG